MWRRWTLYRRRRRLPGGAPSGRYCRVLFWLFVTFPLTLSRSFTALRFTVVTVIFVVFGVVSAVPLSYFSRHFRLFSLVRFLRAALGFSPDRPINVVSSSCIQVFACIRRPGAAVVVSPPHAPWFLEKYVTFAAAAAAAAIGCAAHDEISFEIVSGNLFTV